MSKLEQYAGCDGLLNIDITYHRRCYLLELNPTKAINWENALQRIIEHYQL